jgi:hypothetical protein
MFQLNGASAVVRCLRPERFKMRRVNIRSQWAGIKVYCTKTIALTIGYITSEKRNHCITCQTNHPS